MNTVLWIQPNSHALLTISLLQMFPGGQGQSIPVSEGVYPVGEGQPIPVTDGEYKQIHSFMVDGGDRFGVSSLCFDTQELLWMGNQGVEISFSASSSFYYFFFFTLECFNSVPGKRTQISS